MSWTVFEGWASDRASVPPRVSTHDSSQILCAFILPHHRSTCSRLHPPKGRLENPFRQRVIVDAGLGRRHGQQAGFSHARDRIDFQYERPAPFRHTKIHPRRSFTSQELIRLNRQLLNLPTHVRRKGGRAEVRGSPLLILGRVIKEPTGGLYFDCGQCASLGGSA